MIASNTSRPSPRTHRESGFTLAELLLASVLGAMMLTALGVATFGFTQTLEYHEEQAGINSDTDPVLRQITRDVREAWWIDLVSSSHIKIAAPDGAITEYYLSGSDLMIKRPNGDTGVLADSIDSLVITATQADRNREGTPVDYDGLWESVSATSGAPIAMHTATHDEIAVGFVAPVLQSDVAGMPAAAEEVSSVSTSIIQLPVAWVAGSGAHQFELSIFESRAPGSAKPTGNYLKKISIPGSSLPAAVPIDIVNDVWEVPTVMVPFSIGATLKPGVGYTMLLDPQGDSDIVLAADPVSPGSSLKDVVMGDAYAGSWVKQPVIVPHTISGPFQLTTTSTTSVNTRLTFDLTPEGAPTQTRSAAILSQVITGDPWLGTVPGQQAP